MSKDAWHYPRTEFAEAIYGLLANGPIQAITLFGPRRTGKTEFLLRDLAPLAEDRGYRVIYASFWQTVDTPTGILLYEFDLSLRTGSFLSRLKNAATEIAPKFVVQVPGSAGKIEIDLGELGGKTPESHLLLIDQYCERFASDDRPTFLLFDEFQEVAKGDETKPLIAALRTSLDKRKDKLVAVFTGSSQEGLRAMFSAKDAPFFRFATEMELPALDERFVRHQIDIATKTSKRSIDLDAAIGVFEEFDRNPEFLQQWIVAYVTNIDLGADEVTEKVGTDIAQRENYHVRWLKLEPFQRRVARMLAHRIDQIYGERGAEFLSSLGDGKVKSRSSIQAAVKRLVGYHMVDKINNEWRISDPLLEAWILNRPVSDF